MKLFKFALRLMGHLFGLDPVFLNKAEVPTTQIHPLHHIDFIKASQYMRLSRATYPRIICMKKGDDYLIFDGHHRWSAAKRRGDETVRIKFF